MPTQTKTAETIRLSIEMLKRIPYKNYTTAAQLQEQLAQIGIQRDIRNIQKQLQMLCENFEIECNDDHKPYGYRWPSKAAGFSIPTLTEQDALLLTLAQQHLRNLLPANLMNSMEGFFEQAKKQLYSFDNANDSTTAKRSKEWLNKVRVVSETQALLAPTIQASVFEAVSNALYANKFLKIHYKNAGGKEADYEVMPLGLAQQGTRLYLVCRFISHTNERSLALHRIISATVSTHHFETPSSFNLKKYDDDGRFGFGEGKKIKLSFNIAKHAGQHLLESKLSTDQTATEIEGGYHITATVVDSGHLDKWLLGFGDDVWDDNKN